MIVKEVELWQRDPVECVQESIGNPAFTDSVTYAPEKYCEDKELENRVYGEMAAGDWWWEVQASSRVNYV